MNNILRHDNEPNTMQGPGDYRYNSGNMTILILNHNLPAVSPYAILVPSAALLHCQDVHNGFDWQIAH